MSAGSSYPLGRADDEATTPGASGSLNAKFRLVTDQLDQLIAQGPGGSSSTMIASPIGVSGTVSVNPHAVSQTGGPWAVSGSVTAVGLQFPGVQTVSGTVSINTPGTLGVSGTITVNPHTVSQTGGPWAVSGTVTAAGLQFPGVQTVSGRVAVDLVGPVGISGSVTLAISPDVGQTRGPWAVSGTVTAAGLQFPGVQTVSGIVTINTPGTLGVSGTVTVNPHTVSQTAGPWAVSGSVSLNDRPLPGTQAVSGTVTVTGVATDASTLLIGKGTTASATLTRPANTTAYAAGDEMTDTGGAILQFSGMARANGGGGVLTHVVISNSQNAAVKAVFELRLYDTTSTPATDNAAFDASDTVNDTLVALITCANGSDGLTGTGGNCVYELGEMARRYKCAGGDMKLYGRLLHKTAYSSPNSSDTWKITLGYELDPS